MQLLICLEANNSFDDSYKLPYSYIGIGIGIGIGKNFNSALGIKSIGKSGIGPPLVFILTTL